MPARRHTLPTRAIALSMLLAATAPFATAQVQPAETEGQPGPQSEGTAEPIDAASETFRLPTDPAPILAQRIDTDGAPREITEIRIRYARDVVGQPTEADLLGARLLVSKTTEGWVPVRRPATEYVVSLSDLGQLDTNNFFDATIPLISSAIVRRFQELGFIGVYAEPDPRQIRIEDGAVVDARAEGDTSLTVFVTMGVVADVRTLALGARFEGEETINIPQHDRILENTPVAPLGTDTPARRPDTEAAESGEDTPSERPALIRRDLIDRYVHRLNRHPGRQVDVAVVPTGEEFGGVSLDYLVTENKPWLVYAQIGNTGSSGTSELQERFGFLHYQLTDSDDILNVSYLTGNFDEVNALTASYDRPLTKDGRLRGRIFGSAYEYTSSDVGQTGLDFEGEGYSVGLEARGNIHQDDDFFIDALGGLRVEGASVDNQLAGTDGSETFLIASAGLRGERFRRTDRFNAGLTYEVNTISGNDDDLTALGRTNTSEVWTLLKYDAAYSFYLEPLFESDPNTPTPLAHELSFSTRGQWAFDNRLPPNFQQVAGGQFTVRGYPESLTAGDSVFVASAEYRFHLPQGLAPRVEPARVAGSPFRIAPQFVSGPTDWDLIFKGFVDVGRVLNSDVESFETNQTLLGAGFGLEAVIGRNLRGEIDFAWAGLDVEDAAGANRVNTGDFEVHFLVTLVY
ncbi:MAG: ShlB/FhaC/HecB family hemolysin secretion/activation protein [Planctomycetota bacterium]